MPGQCNVARALLWVSAVIALAGGQEHVPPFAEVESRVQDIEDYLSDVRRWVSEFAALETQKQREMYEVARAFEQQTEMWKKELSDLASQQTPPYILGVALEALERAQRAECQTPGLSAVRTEELEVAGLNGGSEGSEGSDPKAAAEVARRLAELALRPPEQCCPAQHVSIPLRAAPSLELCGSVLPGVHDRLKHLGGGNCDGLQSYRKWMRTNAKKRELDQSVDTAREEVRQLSAQLLDYGAIAAEDAIVPPGSEALNRDPVLNATLFEDLPASGEAVFSGSDALLCAIEWLGDSCDATRRAELHVKHFDAVLMSRLPVCVKQQLRFVVELSCAPAELDGLGLCVK